ncbi:uncharacterized protein zgc:113279 isoform X1 [Channa argus]|uniref:uncharacterized protein zgc:113279 isoform X1 n=1 Tax=Channa argus TaxID=215402 RepID=UPI002946FAA7|nr:hypothetical protein Q8A73_006407 [Channa argus]
MRGRYKRKETKERSAATADIFPGSSPPRPGETAAGLAEQEIKLPVPVLGGGKKGMRCSLYGGEKVYLGVRVKMPVRDLLKNIRQAKGCEPHSFQDGCSKSSKGDKKRVKTRRASHTNKRKCPAKSLEELAIIVEVLEEDLRTCNTYCFPSQTLSSSSPLVSPKWSLSGAGYYSDKSDEMIPSPQSYMTSSPGTLESPPSIMHNSLQRSTFSDIGRKGGRVEEWFDPQNYNWNVNSSAFFWTQLQKEEDRLRGISDAELLDTDELSRTPLHNVACVGKRALGYAIAKRMAALNSLDLKDADGMTALLHAAKHNHHLMVADLINLGANVNEKNNSGKSCLHLSAEKGYFRVLEVLKNAMMDGIYVDVEVTDNSGMSVLQCASLALKATVRELESGKSRNLGALKQEQMMETLECLLQMGSYLHTMGHRGMQPLFC